MLYRPFISELVCTAILAAVIGYLGYYFQDRMSATTLISEQENAESTLRSSMFQSLLGPVLAVKKEGKIDPEHERLIIELLALNFGEHFEFKPLLEHVDQTLTQQNLPLEKIGQSRKSLRSMARRVIQRQIAMIQNQGHGDDLAHITTVTVSKEITVATRSTKFSRATRFRTMSRYVWFHLAGVTSCSSS